jgi:hypothetical protein
LCVSFFFFFFFLLLLFFFFFFFFFFLPSTPLSLSSSDTYVPGRCRRGTFARIDSRHDRISCRPRLGPACVGTSGWARDASYRTVSSPKRLPPPLLDFFVPFSFGTDSAAAAAAAAAAAISEKMFLSASSHLELFLPAESSVGFASTRSQFRYCSTPPTRAKFDGFLRRVGRDLDKRRPILETITTNR